ncbi:MAG: hypothetical protein HC925_06405 [Coleofasciculaceae cyanobacterium SM2_3_26]|nr:hypothetical protein [Coleofasciculaceae cyanobacterium SM2_3_26]
MEVWLVFPESKLVLIATQEGVQGFVSGQSVNTQVVLQGFTVPVDELLA